MLGDMLQYVRGGRAFFGERLSWVLTTFVMREFRCSKYAVVLAFASLALV